MTFWALALWLANVATGGPGWLGPFLGLSPTWDGQRLRAELSRTGGTLEDIRSSHDQALSRMLLESRLLEVINHFGLAPKCADGRFDPSPFAEALRVRHGDFEAWITLPVASSPAARYALFRIPVPVDAGADAGGGWSPRRLRRIKDALGALSACNLQPLQKDKRGNAFAWQGRHPLGWRLHAWYVPEEDELRLLLTVSVTPPGPDGAVAPPATEAGAPPP
ncbi:MAG: hypothetical protein GYA21_18700 [Myxococcales bacterium]|nr:hypothetical protein [Myxococcales bacterium]